MPGVLYIVPTPIGNVADMPPRGVASLQQVDVIACEDTRHSRYLLDMLGIDKPLVALHQHNEQGAAQHLIQRLLAGESVGVISDAGTPVVSDPGAVITALAHANGIQIVPIPGPSAVVTALSASGLSGEQYVFAGFIPSKAAERRKFLVAQGRYPMTTIFYETPHRIAETLADMQSLYDPERTLVIARELTKTFEQIVSLPIKEASAWLASDANHSRGEFVLLVSAYVAETDNTAWQQMADDCLKTTISAKDAAALIAKYTGVKKKMVYQYLIDNK